MILESISLSGWRCYIDPVNIGPFEKGLNVLHGPNATGKSTLFEALLRGLLDGHRVSGKEIEEIRPWGRSLAPTVTVEFSHEETEYRITKRFLDRPSAKLERKENGRYVALAEGSDADERTRKILSRNAPGRGLAKEEHWGIAQVLWAPQGKLDLGALSGDLITDIKTSLGTQVTGSEGGPVEKRVEAVYSRIFTSGGKLKTGKDAPGIVRLEEALKKAREKRAEAQAAQQQFEEASRRVEELRARRQQAKYDAAELSKRINENRTQAESYRNLLLEKEKLEARYQSAEVQYKGLKDRIAQIQSAREAINEGRRLLQKLSDDTPLYEQEKEGREKEVTDSKAELENARKDRRKVDEARNTADEARDFTENRRALERLDGQIGKITDLLQQLTALKRDRSELVAPATKDIRAIQKLTRERDEAQIRIDAALITLEIVPHQEGSLEVISGEEAGSKPLQPGKPTRVKGSPEVVADLPGIARLRASGPAGSIEEYRKEYSQAAKKLRKLTQSFGTDDPVELEASADKANRLDNQIEGTEQQLAVLLSGQTLEEMEREKTGIETLQAKLLAKHVEWEKDPPDSTSLKAAAEEIERSFVGKVEEAETGYHNALAALNAVDIKGAAIQSQLEAAEKQVKTAQTRLAELESDGKTVEARDTELSELAIGWDATKGKLKEINGKLAGFGDDPVLFLDKLERQLQAADEISNKALEEEKTEEGRLQNLSAQGTFTNLVAVEEEIAALEDQFESEELRVEAIRLLHDTLTLCQAETLSAVIGPVEAAATRTMQRITGERLGRLKLGESFEPEVVIPGISGEPVALAGGLSGGEREQIHLATRLALADLLAKEERQLVVFDDVLAATDAGRLARVLTILEEAAQRLQILILTCHPERYRGLGGAGFIDLEAVVRAN